MVQFRNGYVDDKHSYSADQLRWVHNGSDWDVVAIRDFTVKIEAGAWTPKSGGY